MSGIQTDTALAAHVLPDYAGGSLLNLMASIEAACGGPGRGYAPLHAPPAGFGSARHLVLFLVDGLGDALLRKAAAGAFLRAHQQGRLTSVCPSTTASAVTTVLTGLAPAAHGLTGWHIYSSELDEVIAPLPLWIRGQRHPHAQAEQWCRQVFIDDPLANRLTRACHVVSPWFICDSPYNRHHTGRAERWPYRGGVAALFETLESVLRRTEAPTYTYAYYGEIDRLGHEYGISSQEVEADLARLDAALEAFVQRIRGLDVEVVITADHGFLDNPSDRQIHLADHPVLARTLSRPLCGERRLAYASVKPAGHEEFKHCLAEAVGEAVWPVPAHAALDAGWFGPGLRHPRLAERVGDWVLVLREPWVIIDQVSGERPHDQIGVHGGLSAAEMAIPLVYLPPA
ncbi:MAG TPA: alkaline phosphatase family protein [Candidatus Acidoferrales bacterium]|nr:alkaline phosphatase family protein [Candidatus Acidoferrales bacterium]